MGCILSLGHPHHLLRSFLALGCWPHRGLPALFNSSLLICFLHKCVALLAAGAHLTDLWEMLYGGCCQRLMRGSKPCAYWAGCLGQCFPLCALPYTYLANWAGLVMHFISELKCWGTLTKATWMLEAAEPEFTPDSLCIHSQSAPALLSLILLLGTDEFLLPGKLVEN